MKRYLLGLRSGDFTKNGNIWITDPINLYNNDFYKNYSYKRSSTGLNLIGDYTFVGTEVSSPSYNGNHSTPIDDYTIYKTNYGEVVYEPATPNLKRFIDTTSRVDIVSYKHAFTNLPGLENPTFNLQIYESDSENGPWLKSALMIDSSSIFLNNSKPFIKIELEIFSTLGTAISEVGLLLYVEVAIHEPTTNVISDSARNITKRFPSWTEIYEDSFERSTPELATPISVGGAFVNSLVGEYLDDFTDLLDENQLNSFISSADEDMLDWIYVSYNIPASAISVLGDGIQLAKAPSLESFYNSRKTDYIYYHNLVDSQIITVRNFSSLVINGTSYNQVPAMVYNIFDDFGARVNLKRLYLEGNSSFKKRILDVFENPPGVSLESYKLTLRRELDLWRAYGATPESDYLGATPEILEISDIEKSTPYFSFSGNPQEKFINFVKYINETYPSNLGYIKWEEGIWDYAGLNQEGIGRIAAIYDAATPPSDLFQPGIGDFRDAQLVMPNDVIESATTSFTGRFKADGFRVDSYKDVYGPITVGYEYKGIYSSTIPDPNVSNPNSATPFNGGVALVYEVVMPPHTGYATPATYYANLSYNDRDDFFVYNYYPQTSAASPEYNLIPIVGPDNLTDTNIIFREKTYDYIYRNFAATPTNSSIDISKATSISVVNKVQWNPVTNSYVPAHTGQYRVAFNSDSRGYVSNPSVQQVWSLSTPNINYINSNIKIGSSVYGTKTVTGVTDPNYSSFILNDTNNISELKNYLIEISEIKNALVYPINSTPNNIVIENSKVNPFPMYNTAQIEQTYSLEYGGFGLNYLDNQQYFVPSSPNVIISTYADAASLQNNSPTFTGFFNSATISYSATPDFILFSTGLSATPYYPFKQPVWIEISNLELLSTPMINGYVDHLGNVYKDTELIEDSGRSIDSKIKDSYLSSYNLYRETFGIDSSETNDYIITHINPISDTPGIDLTTNKKEVMPHPDLDNLIVLPFTQSAEMIEEMYNESSSNYYYSEIKVNAQKISSLSETNILENADPQIHTGWLYLPESEYYIYAKPKTEYFSGILFDASLSEIPRQGSPLIVDVVEGGATIQYQEIMFPDLATPGKPTFNNTEYIYGSNDKALYISYANANNIVIKDSQSGKYLVEDPIQPGFYIWSLLSEDGYYIMDLFLDEGYYIVSTTYTLNENKLEVFSATTSESIIVPGTLYEISYDVSNSYYVDKNIYNEQSDSYNAKVYFSATPDATASYSITYETAINEFSTPSDISLSSVGLPITKGFIYISDNEYDFGSAEITVSPKYISGTTDSIVYLTITSYDKNGNLKPNQTFYIDSSLLTPESNYITTNEYGLAVVKLNYSGPVPATSTIATVNIQGMMYSMSTPSIDINSSSSPFYDSISIFINRESSGDSSLKAIAVNPVIKSDSISTNFIKGNIKYPSLIPGATPVVYWRKARSVYSAIEEINYSIDSSTPGKYGTSGAVYANQNGEFNIGPFYSQNITDPGYWFVVVDSAMSDTLSSTPVTIIGDIAYWYEDYENISYDTGLYPLPYNYTNLRDSQSAIIQTPAFRFNHYDMDHLETAPATINWNPPKWLPINYYDQYQMGLLGSTPNVVSTYSNIVNDFEES